jgi:hypothetical protein
MQEKRWINRKFRGTRFLQVLGVESPPLPGGRTS